MTTQKNKHGIRISTAVFNYLNDNFWFFTKSTTKKMQVINDSAYFIDVIYATKKERDFEMNEAAGKIAASAAELSGMYTYLSTVTY